MAINASEYEYLAQLQSILDHGDQQLDRTGTGTRSLFGLQNTYDLSDYAWPVFTTKKVYTRGVIGELLWMLNGDTNIKYLTDNNIHIWNEWADANGDLGPVYGAQWRHWLVGDSGSSWIDQIQSVTESIKEDPFSRRHIVSAWNAGEVSEMALPPCHLLFQFNVRSTGHLDLQLYQRSADMFLGVPFNVASYSLLLMLVARHARLTPGVFVHTMGNAHIYNNHVEQVQTQLERVPKDYPRIEFPTKKDIFSYCIDDFTVVGYNPDPGIKAPVSI